MMLLLDVGICGLSALQRAQSAIPQHINFSPNAPLTSDATVGYVVGAFFTEPPVDITYTLTDDQNSNLEVVGNEIRVGGDLGVGTYTLTVIASNETGWSQTITQTLSVEEPIPSWVPRDHLGAPVPFVLDAENNRGWYNETVYSSETDFLTTPGVSGIRTSGVRTFGPYDIPGAANEFPGVADLSATTALTAVGSGSSIASVGGELELTSGGSGARWRFNLPLLRKAYRWRLKGRRGTNTSGQLAPASALNLGMTGGIYIGANFNSVMGEQSVIVPSASSGQRYAGVYQANSTTGTSYFDDVVLTEVKPFAQFNQAEGTIVIEGIADSSGTDQVLFELSNTLTGQSGDRDYIRFTRSASTGQISGSVFAFQTNVWAEGANMATVANGAPIRIAIAWKDAVFTACVNGSAPFVKTGATQIESYAIMRFAGNLAGNAWSGFRKGCYIPQQQPNWWLQHASTHFDASDIWAEGDSYTAGANGVSLSGAVRSDSGRTVINTAVGGSTLVQVRDRLLSSPSIKGKPLIIWDGSANSYTSVAYTCGLIDDIIEWHGDAAKIIFVPSVSVGPSSNGIKTSYTSDMETIRDYIAASGVHSFDPTPLMNALAAGSAQDLKDISAGVVCQSLLQDTVHLTNAAMAAVADEVVALIVANGL
ncbi:SGNH/GDSL hydrolase family protein [Rhizobium sp. XQZ8]|uniref:SGNH/GDSL hydrolase family protein n=1 Tax=Rhizobium populisoli TaxID=2859785 RepID=UPI001CA54222|nr:SGNH/GDSL hydrolase family protein [Rhizobium populisoli]MBW6420394.1 SGNH/GDSL hydrolase family protein [Rhizobium populisoli]